MKTQTEMPQETLESLVRFRDVSGAPYEELLRIIRSHPGVMAARPEPVCQTDPRSGDRVVYSPSRKLRPHTNSVGTEALPREAGHCPICKGGTTPVVDVAPLSEGFTFINENLYPILFPHDGGGRLEEVGSVSLETSGKNAAGAHFVQWASTRHDSDIQNMPRRDVKTILERLAALEKHLLHTGNLNMPPTASRDQHGHWGHVGIIKNCGPLVGGSIAHGHMQIIHTNILPRAIEEDVGFLGRFGESFSSFFLRENPTELLVKDYGCVYAAVPYFMKRPLDAIIAVKCESRNWLHELDPDEIAAMAAALREVTGAVAALMLAMGLELAYNLVFHTGPIGGLYVEVLPLTQVLGGYEKMGLYLCDGLPSDSAAALRKELQSSAE